MRKIIDNTTRLVLVFLMGLLVVDVVWQVFSRYVLNVPSTFTDELARFLLIWVSILGAAYLSGKNGHVAITFLPDRLSPSTRLKLDIFIRILIIAFVLCVLVIGGGILVYYTYTYLQLTPTLQIPMAFVYLIGPISGLLIIYYKISDITELLQSQSNEFEQTEEKEFEGTI